MPEIISKIPIGTYEFNPSPNAYTLLPEEYHIQSEFVLDALKTEANALGRPVKDYKITWSDIELPKCITWMQNKYGSWLNKEVYTTCYKESPLHTMDIHTVKRTVYLYIFWDK